MIEDTQALRNIDRIAATPGVDVVFAGTGDLSFSLGLRGEQNHPKLERALDKIVAAAKRHNKILGRIVTTSEQARKAIDQGFLFLQVPTELQFLSDGAGRFLEGLGQRVEAVKSQAFY